jgi:hypothetical protein
MASAAAADRGSRIDVPAEAIREPLAAAMQGLAEVSEEIEEAQSRLPPAVHSQANYYNVLTGLLHAGK